MSADTPIHKIKQDADFFKFQVPHRSDPGLGMGRYHDMGDVLKRLGNRTLSFLGDSVASQHAHAMECSWCVLGFLCFVCTWAIRTQMYTCMAKLTNPIPQFYHTPRLRSGKARTLFYEKEDFHRIFSANGTGFSRAGRYGTNALYTWRTETKVDREEDGEGVQGTMKLYMTVRHIFCCLYIHVQERERGAYTHTDDDVLIGPIDTRRQYRPWMNETQALLDSSDTVVVNFGLHYLMEDRKVFEEEMRTLLEVRRIYVYILVSSTDCRIEMSPPVGVSPFFRPPTLK